MEEIWKDVPGYEGYRVSNIGDVSSSKVTNRIYSDVLLSSEGIRLLKKTVFGKGYLMVNLRKNGKTKPFPVHQLVAMTFLNHIPCGHKIVVDHINEVKTDNRVENLQLISNRENSSRCKRGKSKYIGVSYSNSSKRWLAHAYFDGKQRYLGCFKTEEEARDCYLNKIKSLTAENAENKNVNREV